MSERKRHVLIVDPDSSVEEALKPILNEYGYETRPAASAFEGFQEVMGNPPALMLIAVALPDASGVELFDQVRKRSRSSHIPVMFIGGYGEGKRQKEILEAGADDFVVKPFDADLLALRIRNAVQRTERDGLTHPRSGLPTGRLLRERIRALADDFGWYKIDFIVNHFDAFLSRYGFMAAEEVMVFAANLVNEVVRDMGTEDDFVGQRDDNTFIIITTLERGAALGQTLEQRFNEEVQAFYNFMEREQGYIEVESGDSFVQRPLMTAEIKFQEGEPDE